MSAAVFPFDDADAYLASLPCEFTTGTGFREWRGGFGATRFAVEPLGHRTPDGRVVQEVVTVSHESDRFRSRDAVLLAHLNKLAPLGAVVPAESGRPARFVTKAGVFAGDNAAARLIDAPLVCMQASLAHWHVAQIVKGELECKGLAPQPMRSR